MRKTALAIAVAALLALSSGCGTKQPAAGQGPEDLFNAATEAMVKGDDAVAIELYYKLVDGFPDFKKYRADAVYRLGSLLFKTERYEEAEKVLQSFALKYPSDPRLKKAYESLLHIYMEEIRDEAKAKKVRDLYAARFSGSQTLESIDKTMQVLNTDQAAASKVLALDSLFLGILGSQETAVLDREFFPVRNYIVKSVRSPDGRMTAEKKKAKNSYAVYYGPATGAAAARVPESTGGYAPQWSWEGRYILFTSMDWSSKARRIKVFDTRTKTTREVFKAKGVEPLVCISPDSSKIVFSYKSRLWIMNRGGNSVTLLSKTVDSSGARMMAWSRDGDKIIFSRKASPQSYTVCSLGRREIETIK